MHCPQCQQANPVGAKFRNECGAPLPRPCHACGQANPPQAKFCNAYGTSLSGDVTGTSPSQPALALAEELRMRPLQAHCHRGLDMLYAATGQQEQVRAELSTAMEMYRTMEMTFWLPQVEAVLAQTG